MVKFLPGRAIASVTGWKLMEVQSPRIIRLTWGRVEVEGDQTFKDAILYPGGCQEWDWRVTGTNHSPGIQPADVEMLLVKGAVTVVLSLGMNGRLLVAPATRRLLVDRGVEAHIARTEEAVSLYNRLREEGPVGTLIHSTC